MSHSAVLSWAAPSDATSTSTYNIYSTPNACPSSGLGTLTWTKIASGLAALTYTDTTVTVGNSYCYYATQVQGGIESAPGATAGGSLRPGSVTSIQIVLS